MHWKEGITNSLWPMEVHYACYLYNYLPNLVGMAPGDLFFGQHMPCHKLKDIHTWGCPVYVSDPKLQQGHKLSKCPPEQEKESLLDSVLSMAVMFN